MFSVPITNTLIFPACCSADFCRSVCRAPGASSAFCYTQAALPFDANSVLKQESGKKISTPVSSFSFKYLPCHSATPAPDDSIPSPTNIHLLAAHTLTYLLSSSVLICTPALAFICYYIFSFFLYHITTPFLLLYQITLLCKVISACFPDFQNQTHSQNITGYILMTGAEHCLNMLIATSYLQLDSSESVFISQELRMTANLWCFLP